LEHVGVLSRSVEDCGLFLSAVAGHDPADPASANQPLPVLDLDRALAAPRLGLVCEALQIAAPQMREHLLQVAGQFEAAGARVEEVSLGEPLDLILAVQHVIMHTEVAAVHWQLLEQYPGSHLPKLRATVEVGRLLPGVAYLHAQRLRRRIRAAMARCLAQVDAFVLPTAVDVAPTRESTGDTSLQAPFSLVGFPSLSLPSGLLALQSQSLPLAIQLVAPAWHEAQLLAVGRWCEAQLPVMPPPPLFA
ncbi:MAG: amidase family protein, partial [Chloroflexota bacterium]